jgi:hypothetical protein
MQGLIEKMEREDFDIKIRLQIPDHKGAGRILVEVVGEEEQIRTDLEVMTNLLLLAIFGVIMTAKIAGSSNAPAAKILIIKKDSARMKDRTCTNSQEEEDVWYVDSGCIYDWHKDQFR